MGAVIVPVPVTGQTAYNAFVQPLIDRYGYVAERRQDGRRHRRLRHAVRQRRLLPRRVPVRLQPHARHERACTTCTSATSGTRTRRTWTAARTAGATITSPAARTELPGPADLLPDARSSSRRPASCPRSTRSTASQSFELNDTIRWKDWTFNVGLLVSNDTLYGQGLREDASALSGYALAPGNKYEMYEIGFGKMLQPRARRDLGLQRQGHDLRELRHATTRRRARCRAPRPGTATSPTTINAYFDANGVLFATDPVASSSGKLFVDGPDAAHDQRVPARHGAAVQPRAGRRALYGRYREGSHFWEDTNNDARVRFNPPAGHPARALHPGPRRAARRRSAAARATSSPSSTAPTPSTTRRRSRRSGASDKSLRARLVHLEPLLRQLRPGQLDDRQRREHLHRLVEHRRRRRPPAVGLQGRRPARRPPAPAEGLRLPTCCPGTASVGVFAIAQSGQPWEHVELRALHQPHDLEHERRNRYAEPAGSRRSDVALPARPQLHPELPASARATTSRWRPTCFNVFNKQTGYNIEPRFHNSLFGQPRLYFDPRRLQVAARFQF